MKKYAWLWKFLYNKYANSLGTNKWGDFDKLKEKYQEISIGECRKLLDDYSFDKKKWLTKEENQTIVKLVNFKIMSKFEPRALDFEGFKEWIMQAAIYMYSKPGPNDLSSFPALKSLEAFVEKMWIDADQKG